MWYLARSRLPGLIPAAVLAVGVALAGVAHPAWGQSGTLSVPAGQSPSAKPKAEAPMTPPAAAPRQPVHPASPRVPPPTQPAKPTAQAQPAGPPARPQAALPLPLPPPPPPPPPPLAPEAEAEQPSRPTAEESGRQPAEEGRKLPRFASLKSDTVNLRAGPGTRYPIQWVYNRRDLPVEIEREFEVWRAVRDPDGVRGWVHSATLNGRRTFVVKGADATVRSDRKDTASAVAILRAGVIGRLRACEAGSPWCEVRVSGHRGYLRRDQIWGLLPDEVVKP